MYVFSLLLSRNFATMAMWHNYFPLLLNIMHAALLSLVLWTGTSQVIIIVLKEETTSHDTYKMKFDIFVEQVLSFGTCANLVNYMYPISIS